MKSLDPRMNRLDLIQENISPSEAQSHWPTYEVFHQKKRGAQAVHAGIVHAPSPELALILAKEQYARRFTSSNIWVVKSSEVYTFDYEDDIMFETTPSKKYRDGNFYKVREKVVEYQAKHNIKEKDDGNYFGI